MLDKSVPACVRDWISEIVTPIDHKFFVITSQKLSYRGSVIACASLSAVASRLSVRILVFAQNFFRPSLTPALVYSQAVVVHVPIPLLLSNRDDGAVPSYDADVDKPMCLSIKPFRD